MDRNPRRAKTILTVVLVLTSLAAGALWLRSYFARDGIWYATQTTRYGLHAYRGRVWFWWLTAKPTPTATVWATPAPIGEGWTWDSVSDKWYDQFPRGPRGIQLPSEFLDAPAQGGGTDRGALGFRYVRSDQWFSRAAHVRLPAGGIDRGLRAALGGPADDGRHSGNDGS
jgi:hypothetical protein